MGRRSVWSDEKVIALAKQFVPAADEVFRLQRDDDPECRLFRKMVRGHERASRGTMQGTYVFSPGGKLLGAINTYSADATRRVMQRALERWNALPESERKLADPDAIRPKFRWEDSFPAAGLVLRRTARDLPRDLDPSKPKAGAYNHDAVWFSKSEARAWLPTELRVGATGAASPTIARRLAQFVLVDNVRGQTLPYHTDELRTAEVRCEITAIEGARVTIAFTLHTHAVSDGPWLLGDNYWKPHRNSPHSITTRGRGKATFDTELERFVSFRRALALRSRGLAYQQSPM